MKRWVLSILALSANTLALAGSAGHWQIGVGVGAAFPDIDATHASPGELWPDDTYTVNDVDSSTIFSLFAGYTWENDTLWFPSYTLRANYLITTSSEVQGHVQQFSLADFENYQYSYDVQSQALLGVFKLDLYRFERLMPFISVGLGAAWNQFNDYQEQAFAGITPRVSPAFGDNTESNLAFLLGAGFDFIASDSITLSLEYNYGDFGQVASSNSSVYSGENLSSDLTTNIVLLSLAYAL